MSSPDGTKLQFNFKTPAGSLHNVYAVDEADAVVQLTALTNLAGLAAETEQILTGAQAAGPLLPQAPVPPNVQDLRSVAQGQPIAPQQPAQPQQQGGPPTCAHGTRVFKEGVSSKGPWKAWMCAARRDDPTKCDAQWIR